MIRMSIALLTSLLLLQPAAGSAEEFCDSAGTDCRARLLAYINAEQVRLDVGMEEMKDLSIADAIVARAKAGVSVRVLAFMPPDPSQWVNKPALDRFVAAGIPVRARTSGSVLHWKMMVFTGQNTVEFAATQFTDFYLVPVQPYVNFTQDPIYFSTETAIVNSFQRRFDDLWVDTTNFVNYANVVTPARAYPTYAVDPSLNFVPFENFLTRAKPYYDAETTAIDVIMYKVTESGHADAMIRAARRGVPVRFIAEPNRYRNKANIWHAYNIDRMYAAGVKIRDRNHLGFIHQKTTLLYGQHVTIFGSSNWTSESNARQYEYNYFTTRAPFFDWFSAVFARKWGSAETKAFVPLPPDPPVYVAPADLATGQATTLVLSWKPGPWAHRADVYLGTTSTPPLYKAAMSVPPNGTAKLTVTLLPGTSYYWRVVSKTMAGKTAAGAVRSFATGS